MDIRSITGVDIGHARHLPRYLEVSTPFFSVEEALSGIPHMPPPTLIFYHQNVLSSARNPAPPPSTHPTLASSLQASWFPVVRRYLSVVFGYPIASASFTSSGPVPQRMSSPGGEFSIASTGTASRVPPLRPSGIRSSWSGRLSWLQSSSA